ncbi:histidine kinase [Streptomyces sp. NPDC089919]|uniref:sensor histidine kinase n=1 Tax=Streptomyces sp. NPDC089919 TaxID=3155188 RepID=UPI00341ED41A
MTKRAGRRTGRTAEPREGAVDTTARPGRLRRALAGNAEPVVGCALFLIWGVLCTLVPPEFDTGLVDDHAVVVVLGWLTSATLLLYRRHPLVPAAAATAFLLVADGRPPLVAAAAAVTAFGGRARWAWVAGMALCYVLIRGVALPTWCADRNLANVLLVTLLLPALFGEAVRRYRAVTALLQARVDRARDEVEQAADLAVIEERTRFAQHTHDVLGHKMTVLVLHAAALRQRAGDEELAERARLLEESARDAMTEVRAVLETLTEPTAHARTFDLDRFLRSLCHNMAVTGMTLHYWADGRPGDVPADDALLLQRAAREGLTNAAKHAPGARTDIRLRTSDGSLRLEVENGPRHGARVVRDTGGLGLTGLRRDFAAAGGLLEAGPAPSGGFLLTASLPHRDRPTPPASNAPA